MKKLLKRIISFTLLLAISMCMVVPCSAAIVENEATPAVEVRPYHWYRVIADTALFSLEGHVSGSLIVCYIGVGSLVRITQVSGLWSKVIVGYSTCCQEGWSGWIETAYLTYDHYGSLFDP